MRLNTKTVLTVLLALMLAAPAAGSWLTDIQGHKHRISIEQVAEKRLLLGNGEGRFHPDRPLTRHQWETVADRIWEQSLKGQTRAIAAWFLNHLPQMTTTTTTRPGERVEDQGCGAWRTMSWGETRKPFTDTILEVEQPDRQGRITVRVILPSLSKDDLYKRLGPDCYYSKVDWHHNFVIAGWFGHEGWSSRTHDERGAVLEGHMKCSSPGQRVGVVVNQAGLDGGGLTWNFTRLAEHSFLMPHCPPPSDNQIVVAAWLRHDFGNNQTPVNLHIEWKREGWLGKPWRWRVVTQPAEQFCQFPYPYPHRTGGGSPPRQWEAYSPSKQTPSRNITFERLSPDRFPPCVFYMDKWRAEVWIDSSVEGTVEIATTAWCDVPAYGETVECA